MQSKTFWLTTPCGGLVSVFAQKPGRCRWNSAGSFHKICGAISHHGTRYEPRLIQRRPHQVRIAAVHDNPSGSTLRILPQMVRRFLMQTARNSSTCWRTAMFSFAEGVGDRTEFVWAKTDVAAKTNARLNFTIGLPASNRRFSTFCCIFRTLFIEPEHRLTCISKPTLRQKLFVPVYR